jgi:hypothetical protein
MPNSRIAMTEWDVGGWPSIAPNPAESARNWLLPPVALRKSPSAMGLRQTFPVQMNKIVFIQRKIQSESSTIFRQS